VHELTIPLERDTLGDDLVLRLGRVEERFHDRHQERYGFILPEHAIEYLHWRATGEGSLTRGSDHAFDMRQPRIQGRPPEMVAASLDATGSQQDVAKWHESDLSPEVEVRGPAIVELTGTTAIVHTQDRLWSDGHGNCLIWVGERTSGEALSPD
jgi:N-methylhydantoinase A